ncbi:putative F-box/LRR-repeat protein 23 [Trifolium pratense]|uniref:putative F-box/LRR-repeat protein 23 n=1 Tax=Trifolium pratense TaxID=57577 RepID=UPI001E69009E|nr:putative F-box/LRR-repeat protein 23 [Trifolium pratense]
MSTSITKEVEVQCTTKPNWLQLPIDVTANILFKLDTFEILKSARNVCSLWWKICKDPVMWQTIHMDNFDIVCLPHRRIPGYLAKICRYAVELSCGHLKDIYIYRLATDDLLKYIVDRACNLRCIRLVDCNNVSSQVLIELGMKLPLLEELDISISMFSGYCLPQKLKEFNRLPYEITVTCNYDAFVIAKSMPGLRRLNIGGHPLDNVGLLAILDGCPRLEFLDLRGCFNLKFSENLEKRCHDQIKDLLLPDDLLDNGCWWECWLDYKCEDCR